MTRIAFAVFISAFLAGTAAGAACPGDQPKSHPTKSHKQADNCVDLNAVPQISAGVVNAEPMPTAAKAPTYSVPTTGPYEGPTLGLTKPEPGVRATPTVGYHWTLE